MLLKINNLTEGSVMKRPSASIKSPYVADVLSDKNQFLTHSPSLGCCGLADVNATVLIEPISSPSKNKKIVNQEKKKCSHRIHFSVYKENQNEIIIGINPKFAETLVESALKQNLIQKLQNISSYKREVSIYINKFVDSRFDFTGVDCNGSPFIMEIKNVPLADYEDVTAKERKSMNFEGRQFSSKVAYFPDGYRKKTTEPVSPRALKHIQELTWIKTNDPRIRCILCFVIQRNDVDRFTPSVIDPIYREALKVAIDSGVEIIRMVVNWVRNGDSCEANFITDELPIVF